jgi:invasion protein IalB
MHGASVKVIEAQQANIYNNKNTKLKLLKKNAAIWLNTICKTKQMTSKYCNIKRNGNNKTNILMILSIEIQQKKKATF